MPSVATRTLDSCASPSGAPDGRAFDEQASDGSLPERRTPDDTSREAAGWLRLSFEQLGALAFDLLARVGPPEAIFSAPCERLACHAPVAIAQRLAQAPPPDMARRIADTLAWAQAPAHTLLALTDPAYPQHLLTIGDPPLLLYVDGDPQYLARPGLAIVGARNATAQGIENACAFAYALACRGLCIVSGMALGIDGAAHRGALAAASDGAGTVAVMGTGLSVIYPRRHQALAEHIRARGALVSELPLQAGPLKSHFPRRNRLVAGLSCGVLVIEAARESGSLITARLANDTGREVFAMPGSIHAPLSRGCHDLIRQGAKLVECAQDVISELSPAYRGDQRARSARSPRKRAPGRAPDSTATPEPSGMRPPGKGEATVSTGPKDSAGATHASDTIERSASTRSTTGSATRSTPGSATEAENDARLDQAIGYAPVHIDTLCTHTSLGLSVVAGYLLNRELAGEVLRLPDGLYQRIKRQ